MTSLRVHGLPAPQGSKRMYVVNGRAAAVESSAKVRPWRQAVITAAIQTGDSDRCAHPDGPLNVSILFWLPRPVSRPRKHRWPDRRPDIDKLTRSTLDGLRDAGIYRDDAQVCQLVAIKQYADTDHPVGAHIAVTPVGGQP